MSYLHLGSWSSYIASTYTTSLVEVIWFLFLVWVDVNEACKILLTLGWEKEREKVIIPVGFRIANLVAEFV